MDKLTLSPQRDSYNPQVGDDVISTKFQTGLPRQRVAFVGTPHNSNVSFLLKTTEFNYFMQFYYAHRATSFGVQLFAIDGALRWYECVFTSSPRHRQLAHNVYSVSIDLTIASQPYE